MGHFTFEIVLAAALALFVAWVLHKQEPKRPLSAEEVERYLAIIDTAFPLPDAVDKAMLLERLRRFGESDDGSDLYMTNLLRYNDRMANGPAAAGRFAGTPREANVIYERNTLPILMRSGAFPIFAGRADEPNAIGGADPADDNWSRILVVHYPSRRHFFNLLTNPQYMRKADFKTYGMYIALTPTKREVVVPDFRFLAVTGAVIVFLAAAWVHALMT